MMINNKNIFQLYLRQFYKLSKLTHLHIIHYSTVVFLRVFSVVFGVSSTLTSCSILDMNLEKDKLTQDKHKHESLTIGNAHSGYMQLHNMQKFRFLHYHPNTGHTVMKFEYVLRAVAAQRIQLSSSFVHSFHLTFCVFLLTFRMISNKF